MWWVVRIFLCRFVYLPWFSVVAVEVHLAVCCCARQSSSNPCHMLCHKNFTCKNPYVKWTRQNERRTIYWSTREYPCDSSYAKCMALAIVDMLALGLQFILAHGTKQKLLAAIGHGVCCALPCSLHSNRTESVATTVRAHGITFEAKLRILWSNICDASSNIYR